MMRSLFKKKPFILFLAILALGALTLLAVSLNDVSFREAQHFGRNEAAGLRLVPQEIIDTWVQIPWWKQASLWVLLGLLVILVGSLLSPEMRKILIRRFIRLALTFWGLLYLFKNYRHLIPALNLAVPESVPGRNGPGPDVPSPVFTPPQVSPMFSYLISFGVALFLLAVVWALYRGWKKYLLLTASEPLHDLARIARSSLHDLTSGRNSSDVIINCYLRMSDVVSDKRQLHREVAMTPREFAARLEQAGLPGEAVARLTRLFEGVRYGDRKSGPQDVNEAVRCLETILQYCGEPV